MRKNILKTLFVGAIVGATTVMIALPSFAANWKMEGKAWKYYTDDGKLVTGWVKDNNKWFYLDSKSGELKTGWFKDNTGKWYFLNPQSDGNKGAMLTGWQWIDGNCYYLNADGSMLANGETPDGYKVNADGKWTDANGNAVFIAGKGIETKLSSQGTSMLNANKKVSLRSSGGSGGGGSHSTGSGSNIGNTADVDNNDKKPESKIEDKKNENKPENKTEAKNENNKPEIKDETKKEENKIETPKKEEKKQELSIKSYEKLADINVDNGLAKEELDKVLPKKVVLTLSDESKREVAITKVDTSKVDTTKAGDYELKVEYDLPEGVVGEKPGVNIKLIVAAPKEVKVESVASIEDVVVDYQMLKSEYEKLLPKKIVLNLNNGSTKEVAVVADSSTINTINTNQEAEYIVKLAYELPDGVVGEKPEASVKVIVTKPSIVDYTPVAPVVMEKDDGSPYWGKFPIKVELILSNGKKKSVQVKKIVIDGYNYQEGEYVVHLQYDMPSDLKGEIKDVVSRITITPKSSISFEKAEYQETENPVLKINNRDLLDTDTVSIDVLRREDDEDSKTLEKDTDYTVDVEANSITLISSKVLKKSYGNSAYASGKLNGDVNLYFEIKLRKAGESGLEKLYKGMNIKYKKAGEESVKPKKEDADDGLKEAVVSNGSDSKNRREDLKYRVYVNQWDALEVSKLPEIKFYIEGTNEEISGISMVSEMFDDADSEESSVLKIPFAAIRDKLNDNSITLYGKGGGYKIKKFTISYYEN